MQQMWRIFGQEMLAAALAFGFVAMALAALARRQRGPAWRSAFLRYFARAVIAGGTLVTLYITMFDRQLPDEGRALDLNLVANAQDVLDGQTPIVQVLGNFLLLTWLGWALGALGTTLRRTALAAIVLSVAIETLQYSLGMGRVASLSDIVLNVLGAAPAWFVGRQLAPRPAGTSAPRMPPEPARSSQHRS